MYATAQCEQLTFFRAWNDRGKERRSPEVVGAGTVGRAPSLVLVVDCRQAAEQPETLEVIRRCWQALCLLLVSSSVMLS